MSMIPEKWYLKDDHHQRIRYAIGRGEEGDEETWTYFSLQLCVSDVIQNTPNYQENDFYEAQDSLSGG